LIIPFFFFFTVREGVDPSGHPYAFVQGQSQDVQMKW